MIPLLGYDGKHYMKYLEWERTFPSVRVSADFPKTQNGHPTLLQHQYLAKSITNYLDKFIIFDMTIKVDKIILN